MGTFIPTIQGHAFQGFFAPLAGHKINSLAISAKGRLGTVFPNKVDWASLRIQWRLSSHHSRWYTPPIFHPD